MLFYKIVTFCYFTKLSLFVIDSNNLALNYNDRVRLPIENIQMIEPKQYFANLFDKLGKVWTENSIWNGHFDISLAVLYSCGNKDCGYTDVFYKYGLVALEIGFGPYVSPIFEHLKWEKLPKQFAKRENLIKQFPVGIRYDTGLEGLLFYKIVFLSFFTK